MRQVLDRDAFSSVFDPDLDTLLFFVPEDLPDPRPGVDDGVHARFADRQLQVKAALFRQAGRLRRRQRLMPQLDAARRSPSAARRRRQQQRARQVGRRVAELQAAVGDTRQNIPQERPLAHGILLGFRQQPRIFRFHPRPLGQLRGSSFWYK